MASTPDIDQRKREAFLGNLAETGNVSASCKAAGLPRATAYLWRDTDEKFKKDWEGALDRGADALQDEATRRAVEGVLKPVYQGGKKVGTVREYSDRLLEFLLCGARPDKYRQRNAIDVNIVANLGARLEEAERRLRVVK